MRFSVAAVALATGAMAQDFTSTDYTTKLVTVTDCAPEVTDCPAASTSISVSTLPLTTSTVYATSVVTVTQCPPEVVDCPADSTIISTETVAVSTTVCPIGEVTQTPAPVPTGGVPTPAPAPEAPAPESPVDTATQAPVPAPAEPSVCAPSYSTSAITKTYTTVLTSVEYATVEVPCPTGGQEQPSASYTPPAVTAPAGGNGTIPQPPVPTAGAASFAGSALFAAAAGIAAFVLA